MKIDVNLDSLWASVTRMGAAAISVEIDVGWGPEIEFDKELNRGVEISLDGLGSAQGLLSVKGRQVLLFIPDHSYRIEDVLTDGSRGNKFHIAHCSKLDEMKQRNRFERYHVTNNLSGEFEIFGYDRSRQSINGMAKLNVCKLCLNHLNYKKSANGTAANRDSIVRSFDIGEFFATYSSLFKYLPKSKREQTQGYTNDWKEVSVKVRQAANYTCRKCQVNLSSEKQLLHVHHKNGVKSDNSSSNLEPLCADCHRKEDFHDHMFIPHSDTQLINHLRREQGLITNDNQSWDSVFEYADPAVHGLLYHARNKNYLPPEIGYEIFDENGQSLATLEMAWTGTKYGICIDKPIVPSGWVIHNIEEALGYFGQR